MTLSATTVGIDDARPLLTFLPDLPDDERFGFVRERDGLVGWGVAGRIPVGTGPDRFERARAGLATIVDGMGDVASDVVAFASFAFDESESVVVVPRTLVRRQDGATRITRIGDGTAAPDTGDPAAVTGDAANSTTRPDRPRYGGSTVRDEVWLEAVARAVDEIDAGRLEKAVLARDLHLWSRSPFDVPAVLTALNGRFPSCMTFLVDHLLGASPELLLARSGRRIASRVLAGTAPRGTDPDEDAALGGALLASVKDRHEHDLALASAVAALTPHCTQLDAATAPSLVRLDNVQHLGTELVGTLEGPTHVLELVDLLHPTAAVGGTPREAALAAIGALEGMSRGRYAGPVGWCTPDGDGEFAIALRCAEISGGRARLFAGAGIVAGSLPEVELLETWGKLRAMTGVLGFTPSTPDGRERA